ncbi:TonB family protein [Myxococcota bacterium]|nr:TonB family protein [Myxococcota bacterium]
MNRMNYTLIGSVAVHVIILIVLQFVEPDFLSTDDEDVLMKEEKKPKIVKFEPIEDKKPEPKKPEPKPEPKKAPPRSSAPMSAQPSQQASETTHVDLTVGLDPNSFGGEGIVVPSGETVVGDVGDMAGPPPMAPERTPPPPEPVVTVKSMPRVLSVPRMPYPEEARRRGIQGEIQILVTVDVGGQVVAMDLKKSVDPKLDELAMAALKKARFAPAMGSDGKPMRYTLVYRYVFRLEDEE